MHLNFKALPVLVLYAGSFPVLVKDGVGRNDSYMISHICRSLVTQRAIDGNHAAIATSLTVRSEQDTFFLSIFDLTGDAM